MKFMFIMRATEAAAAAFGEADMEEVINQMGAYNEQLMAAGVMAGGDGLADDERSAFLVNFDTATPSVTDGYYGGVAERFNGFWIIQTETRDQAIEWARKCPLGPGNRLEVRRITDESDFADFADNDYVQKQSALREDAAGE